MKLTMRMVMEVAHHEAVIRQTYKDSVGVETWSVGLTSATGHDVTRYRNNPASMERCLEVFMWALEKYAQDVREVFLGHKLTEAQFTAALSFHWNTGRIKTRTTSWVRLWKAGDMVAARKAFMKFRIPKEIIKRRTAEADLLFEGRWSGKGYITEYTRLTSSGTPSWRSARRVDVRPELTKLLDPAIPNIPIMVEPTKIKPRPEIEQRTWLTILLDFISQLVTR